METGMETGMTDFLDQAETCDPDERERALFGRLPDVIAYACDNAAGWRAHLAGVDPAAIVNRTALSSLPLLRKADLMADQAKAPPFGGFATLSAGQAARVFMSPGPIFEPQPEGADAWNAARALFAAGLRKGDLVHNAFAYHMTPGGFILDQGAIALGCSVFPAGAGNTEAQVQAMAALRPNAYVGTPDYLKVILDQAAESDVDVSSLKKALVSGGALFPSLRAHYAARGVAVLQTYATAELGCIAYETAADTGLVINEDYIVEIVSPGTGDPVPDGEVGEVVVTAFKKNYPMIRLATGDLSAILPGQSPCGRTNRRIRGWLGRADQRTKVKGMFIDPKQVADIARALAGAGLGRMRLVVRRMNEKDVVTLQVEAEHHTSDLSKALAAAFRDHCKMKADIELVRPGTLPNDGKVIADERQY